MSSSSQEKEEEVIYLDKEEKSPRDFDASDKDGYGDYGLDDQGISVEEKMSKVVDPKWICKPVGDF